jgi:ribosomal protein S18 acetylase RimI-like enzyme
LAYQNGQIVGRVAGIINHLDKNSAGQPLGRFNWIDFIDDPDVSMALLETVEAWVKGFQVAAVHGPMGFTDMDSEGMLVEGFDQLSTMITFYNHPYYREHLERLGYAKSIDWVEYEITVPAEPVDTISRVAEAAKQRGGLRVLKVNKKKDILKYARQMFDVYNEAYQHLYGVVPLTDKQVAMAIKQYFGLVLPEFIPFVINEQDELVGFGITMPSLSQALQKSGGQLFPFGFIHLLKALNKPSRADLYLIGVKDSYRGKGVNAIMMDHILKTFQRHGITKVESNPELETNNLVQSQWKYFEKRQHKRRRVFIKQLNG